PHARSARRLAGGAGRRTSPAAARRARLAAYGEWAGAHQPGGGTPGRLGELGGSQPVKVGLAARDPGICT
ncbi:hypothetical protein, partial [Streptomyces sp. NPDC002550]